MIQAQPAGGAGPNAAALILVEFPDAAAGQSFLRAILDPGALEKAMQPGVAGNP